MLQTYVEVAKDGGHDVASVVSDGSTCSTAPERIVHLQLVIVRVNWRSLPPQSGQIFAKSRI